MAPGVFIDYYLDTRDFVIPPNYIPQAVYPDCLLSNILESKLLLLLLRTPILTRDPSGRVWIFGAIK